MKGGHGGLISLVIFRDMSESLVEKPCDPPSWSQTEIVDVYDGIYMSNIPVKEVLSHAYHLPGF